VIVVSELPRKFRPCAGGLQEFAGFVDGPVERFVDRLREQPEDCDRALMESYNKRGSPTTYIEEVKDHYEVGWFDSDRRQIQGFSDFALAVADYVLFSFGKGRLKECPGWITSTNAAVQTSAGPLRFAGSTTGSYNVATGGFMKTRIVAIGNSKGVRIPKSLLEQTGLCGDVEIRAEGDVIVIRPAKKPREGWSEAFRRMAERGDDALLDGDAPSSSSFDREEWEWK
jgi:antitoxin MazE